VTHRLHPSGADSDTLSWRGFPPCYRGHLEALAVLGLLFCQRFHRHIEIRHPLSERRGPCRSLSVINSEGAV
jgi:hypothetical protein